MISRLTLLLIIGFLSLSIQAQTWELVHHEDFGTGYSGQPLPNNAAKSGFNNNDYGSSGAGNDRCMTSLLLSSGVYLTLEFTLSDTYEYYVSFNVKTDDPVGAEFALYHNTSVGASGTTIDNAITVPYIVAGQPWQEFSSSTITGLNGDHHFIISKGVNDPSTGNEWNRVDDFKLYRRLVGSGNNPPTISLTQPTDGTTFDENESISLAATASDSDGAIQSVQFYYGTTLINEDTTAPFEATISGGLAAGNYTLKAVATDDDGDTGEDQISITINQPTGGNGDPVAVCSSIAAGSDDVEERSDGDMKRGQNRLEIINDGGNGDQTIGLRFLDLNIPQGATITSASIQFTAATDDNQDPCQLNIYGEATDDAAGFLNQDYNLSSRSLTTASVAWSPATWSASGQAGNDQQTADISTVIQEIVNRAGYTDNSAIALIINGSGRREAIAYNDDPNQAAELCVTYSLACIDADEDGSCADEDCDDNDAAVHPNATEICDGIDNNCDGNIDEGLTGCNQAPVSICTQINTGSDDAEEFASGEVNISSTDLELINEGANGDQTVGMRFVGLNIPQGATISNAYIQFTVEDNNDVDPCQVTIYGQASDDAPTFTTDNHNITNRPLTTAAINWSPSGWPNIAETGLGQQTVDIAALIQEIVNRSGYTASSAIAILINGNGRRTAESYDGAPNLAPELCVTYTLGCIDIDDDGICADEDCDDNNATVFPSAPEICDGIDNDCDGEIDEDIKIVGLETTVQDACEGQSNGSIELSIPSDSITYTFAWDNDSTSTQLDSLEAGEYCVTITTSQGCTVNKCYTVGTKICKEMTVTPMNVLTQSDGSAIRIRWAINDYDIWRLANTQGYTIRRTVYTRDTVQLSLTEQLQTSVVLTDQLLPLAPGSWTGQFPGDDRGIAAEQILYSNEWDIEVTGSPTFADAVQTQQMNENRLFFALFMADQDFDLAQAMALGYEDNTAVAGEQYVYTVIINNTSGDNGRLAGSSFGDLENQGEELIAPTELSAEGKDKKIVIGWSMDFIDQQYTSFDIFRSEDGQNFTQANQAPFVFGADDQADARNAFYADSLGSNGTYYYHIIGRTPFGLTGPPSETIEATARPPRLDVQLFIDSLQVDTAYAWLGWEALDIAYNDSLTEFNVYRALHINDPYELITSTPLAITERHYQDDAALSESYYILEATDAHGHIYQSPPKFVQLPDLTPPAIPQGISGLDEAGIVTLNWQANTEPDLKGYRIYRSFVPNGEFVLVSDGTISANTFSDDISNSILTDTVYYQVQSSDIRSNYSEVSPAIAILRTDITPPALPVLFKAMPTPAGVALGWRYSSSEDVVYHELQRKPKGTPDWEAILTISNEEQDQYVFEDTTQITATCYLDESDLERREYEYQFIAYDDSGLSAGSEIIVLRPYDTGQRGSIEDFQIKNDCDWVNGNSSIDLALKDKMEQVITEYEAINTIDVALRNSTIMGLEMAGVIESTEMATWQAYTDLQFYNEINTLHTDYLAGATERLCKLKLDWSYAMEANMGGFEIHRSRDGSRMRLYKTLPIEFFFESGAPTSGTHSFAYRDEDTDTSIRYVYKIMAVYSDGGYSELSRPLTLVVE